MKTLDYQFIHRDVCATHGIFDVLPCPWPDCKNGISEDQFELKSVIEDKAPTTYARQVWQSPLGNNYYSWDREDMPNWFSVKKTIWSEFRRLKLVKRRHPELVYHYTSLEALVGIVKSRTIWLTDYSYLNDKLELTHGIDILTKEIEKIMSEDQSDLELDFSRGLLDAIENQPRQIFVASFSREPDSLSQWRSYGPIAIGFDAQNLVLHGHQAVFGAIEYDPSTQKQMASVYLAHLIQAYKVDIQANRLKRIPDIYLKSHGFMELLAFFKNPAFKDEREYRSVYVEYLDIMEQLNLSPPARRFRVSNKHLLPYILADEIYPTDIGDPDTDFRALNIQEVILGPDTDELLLRGVSEFLAANDLTDTVVRRSKVPYRT